MLRGPANGHVRIVKNDAIPRPLRTRRSMFFLHWLGGMHLQPDLSRLCPNFCDSLQNLVPL